MNQFAVPTPEQPFRVLVTGSRYATEEHFDQIQDAILEAIAHIPSGLKHLVIVVHGNQKGVDLLAAAAAGYIGAQAEPHDASDFGPWPAAGPKRNAHMVSLGANICLGFPERGSKGTWDCAKKAADAGIYTDVQSLVSGGLHAGQ